VSSDRQKKARAMKKDQRSNEPRNHEARARNSAKKKDSLRMTIISGMADTSWTKHLTPISDWLASVRCAWRFWRDPAHFCFYDYKRSRP